MSFLCQSINYTNEQFLWRNKFNLLHKHPNQHGNYFFIWKRSLFGKINFTKFKVKGWRFYVTLFFFFYKKVVIALLKYGLSTLKRTPIFFWYKQTSRSVRNKVFYHINRKRERKKRWQPNRRKELSPFFLHPKLCFHLFFFLVFL
jgi:hypothetical protein